MGAIITNLSMLCSLPVSSFNGWSLYCSRAISVNLISAWPMRQCTGKKYNFCADKQLLDAGAERRVARLENRCVAVNLDQRQYSAGHDILCDWVEGSCLL